MPHLMGIIIRQVLGQIMTRALSLLLSDLVLVMLFPALWFLMPPTLTMANVTAQGLLPHFFRFYC